MTLVFESVRFEYPGGVTALEGVSLSVNQGERVALIGENGAGKTTLAKHMIGLLLPSKGRVLVQGFDTRSKSVAQLSRFVGYVFQNPDEQLFKETVFSEVAFGPTNMGHSRREVETLARSALAKVGLEEELENHPYDLLPSQRKLLGIASVLAMDTPILVLDEPTMGLDLFGTRKVSSVLEHCHSEGKTVILISHDLDFCTEHVQRYIIMADGRLQRDADIDLAFAENALLDHAGLEPPQLVRLARGLGISPLPGTVQTFVEQWANRRTG